MVKADMKPSDMIQVGGVGSLVARSRKGVKKVVSTYSRSKSEPSSSSDLRGIPSGIVSNRKSADPSRQWRPPELSIRLWTRSVLTNVIWSPL
ncbi:hypothetical protein HanXRQr2_Chr09g0403221 [Helianthus annuus]|uniref:Uncharacterized protein n=1 Tax=Helianthus annuus TaxID=4232 RepID=A0A9K3N9R1_HELAN|nr:hypothetical protein HanXRQr2_Chr09g0403221 [Helianthus annuus]KAJ0894440.1 hypothetical protein HanPSC8_Chr09g0389101 [Helianthus annuus]